MLNNVQDIDLDAFFGTDLGTTQTDLQQGFSNAVDIDQAINNALAQIDESSKSSQLPLLQTSPYHHQHQTHHQHNQHQHHQPAYQRPPPQASVYQASTPTSQNYGHITSTPQTQQKEFTPVTQYKLSQAPLPQQMKPLSPASLLSDDSSSSPQTPSINEFEISKLKEAYETKNKQLETIMKELKKSEKKRLLLMKENKQLKETLVKMTMEF